MVVIYAEKASLAKAIAVALNGGNRIAHPKENIFKRLFKRKSK